MCNGKHISTQAIIDCKECANFLDTFNFDEQPQRKSLFSFIGTIKELEIMLNKITHSFNHN